MSQSADFSRQPLSNRADRESDGYSPPNVRLAEQDGTKLRDEVTYDGMWGVQSKYIDESVTAFGDWYDAQRDTHVVVENGRGERTGFRTPNRFTPEYREMLYAKAQSLERGLRERWGKMLHTAMVTLTASSTDAEGKPRPPVEHLRDLLSSWEAVRRSLSRVLDGRDWEYLAILEPHESGYAHVHLGVFVKGPVVAEQFAPVLDAHLGNCPTAGEDAHRLFDDDGEEDTVTIRRVSHASREGGVQNLGAYLAAYMAGDYGVEATEMPGHVQQFYATMWATGRQWFRPSNGAQELMQPERDDGDGDLAEQWRLIGIAPEGDLDEVVEFDPTEERRSVYRRIRCDPPPD